MPLSLLRLRLDLPTLANMDDAPDIAADWLRERYERETDSVALADVALMFGQGFKLPPRATVTYPPGMPGGRDEAERICRLASSPLTYKQVPILPPGMKLEVSEPHWHLPQATLAVWLGCVVGAEARQAVEAWRVERVTGRAWDSATGFSESGGHMVFGVTIDGKRPPQSRILDEAAAARELRRRVLGLPAFAGVRRAVPCEPCKGSGQWMLVGYPVLTDDKPHKCPPCNGLGCRWIVASDFVPPEPATTWDNPPGDIREAVRRAADAVMRSADSPSA